tara:strand:- start:168 stop:479 length:312 start_codon:yes stop_codon:yes gene_type:complete
MAYWILATYTRTNTDTAWFSPSEEVVAKVNEYKDSGKIVHYEIKESDNQLNQYIKIGFSDVAESSNFKEDSLIKSLEAARVSYGESNPVSWSVEDRQEVEPTI